MSFFYLIEYFVILLNRYLISYLGGFYMILKNFIVKLLFILIVILCLVYSATSFAIESSYIWSDSSNFEQSLKQMLLLMDRILI